MYPQTLPVHKRDTEQALRHTLAWAKPNVLRWLYVLDEHWLGAGHRYLCGHEPTIADYLGIAHATVGEVVHIDYSRWPNVAAWIARMKDRPSWAKANEAFYAFFVQPYAQAQFEPL